jgi:hypothetical protein
MEQLLEDLNDNHGGIYPPDEVEALAEAITIDENDQEDQDELPSYGDFQVAAMVTDHPIEEQMTEDSWLVSWGSMKDSIADIQVKAMWLFAKLNLSKDSIAENGLVDTYNDALSKLSEADQITAEVAGMAKIMDRVMADLMALSSGELPQLRRIGSRTCGAISNALSKQLPNGWFFSLSNEVYLDMQGKCYENIGVPLDFELGCPTDRQTFFRSVLSDLANDKRQILPAIEKL